jgi:hypothetical protein
MATTANCNNLENPLQEEIALGQSKIIATTRSQHIVRILNWSVDMFLDT